MSTFTQLNARLENFLNGWLLVLGLKECLVEYATLCIKSEVILTCNKQKGKFESGFLLAHYCYFSKRMNKELLFLFFSEIYLEGSMPQKPIALLNLTESSFYTINLLVETMANKVEKAAANFTLGKLS